MMSFSIEVYVNENAKAGRGCVKPVPFSMSGIWAKVRRNCSCISKWSYWKTLFNWCTYFNTLANSEISKIKIFQAYVTKVLKFLSISNSFPKFCNSYAIIGLDERSQRSSSLIVQWKKWENYGRKSCFTLLTMYVLFKN